MKNNRNELLAKAKCCEKCCLIFFFLYFCSLNNHVIQTKFV